MSLLDTYMPKTEFESYKDFRENFRINIPDNFNFAYDVVDVIAANEPGKKALVWCDDSDNEKILTFADMKYYSDKTANFLKSQGIKRGDPVMLILKGNYEFWFCIIALHKLGAIAIPATHMLTDKDFVYRIKRADIKMVISVSDDGLNGYVDRAHEECAGILEKKVCVGGKREGWISFDEEMEAASDVFERPTGDQASENSDISLLYFTSGTTGFPKMAQHNYAYPLGHILTAKYWQNVQEDGLHYTVADTGWAKAVWGKIYGQWIAGSSVFVYDYEVFDAEKMMQKIEKYKVTTFCAPPTVYRFLIKNDITRFDFSGLKYCVVAGEPLNPEVYDKFLEYTGIRLMEGFGQTELTVAIATYPWMEPKPGSMGKPSPGYAVELHTPEGKVCDPGEEGQIVLNTDREMPAGMFDGYYRDPDQTKKAWSDGYYRTGDMAWMDEDGYYWFIGRADDVIKSSGYKIGPFEVESALIVHPAVMECAITAVPDPVRGQVVKATVVLTSEYKASDELVHELQDHVKKVTAPYKYPRIVEFVEELPKTISGKIRRVEIRETDSDLADRN